MKRINVFLTRNWLRDKIHINIQMQKTALTTLAKQSLDGF